MIDLRPLCGQAHFVWVVFDSLRYDVACHALQQGQLSGLAPFLGAWEERHTPANFTFAAHQAFFAGFLPTPLGPGPHARNLALEFAGSSSLCDATLHLGGANLCEGLRQRGYRTVCIGGVGFFNRLTPLSRVLPDLFCESHWSPELGVTCREAPENQVEVALRCLRGSSQPLFLYLNISATHQPSCIYLEGAQMDDCATQTAALVAADQALQPLWLELRGRGAHCWVFSDHGTAFGEDGYWGHRNSHPVVMHVPYAEFSIERSSSS